ncbi:putative ankyrin repeat-containing domain-containing protein [Helianthus debilis subsp. tardiflorus]
MLCLIKSQVLFNIIDAEHPFPGDKSMIAQYDQLVKGWIFCSVNEKVLKHLVHFNTAREVWRKLESFFIPIKSDSDREDSVGFKFENEFLRDIPEMENTDRKILYEAAVEGWWWKAKYILRIDKSAATVAINENADTILHVAVEMGQNYFVEKLLEFLKDGKDIETQNSKGRTALHIAAMVGNTHAAQLLVQKRKELLVILDSKEESPLDIAYANKKINTCTYFLKCPDLSLSSDKCQENAILAAILVKQYDLARSYLEKYPKIARENDSILSSITKTFPSDLGFTASFIYPCISLT